MKLSKVFVELDGILGNFIKTVCNIHEVNYESVAREINQTRGLHTVLGMGLEEFWNGIHWQGSSYWANAVDPYPWAYSLIDLLQSRYGKDNVFIVVSLGPYSWCAEGGEQWIKTQFGKMFQNYVFTPSVGLLAKPSTVMISSYVQVEKNFESAGGHTVLFPQAWNRIGRISTGHVEGVLYALDQIEYGKRD